MNLETYIPTQEQFQTVIDNLNKACEIAQHNCPVDMMEGIASITHPCGTPMCHAGWYAVAALADKGKTLVNYYEGATAMAKHLGFENAPDLEKWAYNHSVIWGNRFGHQMFCDGIAFVGATGRHLSHLDEIIDHWKGVKERAVSIQLVNNPI